MYPISKPLNMTHSKNLNSIAVKCHGQANITNGWAEVYYRTVK